MQVPRQLSPGQAGALGQDGCAAVAGTSSFGMSGINAHMLLSAGGQTAQVRFCVFELCSTINCI